MGEGGHLAPLCGQTPARTIVRLSLAGHAKVAAAAAAARRLAERHPDVRQERLAGIHNPWGVGAVLTDAWAFLDLAECQEIISAAAQVIGNDIVLWDSELFLDPQTYLAFSRSGGEGPLWPIEPLAGAVVLVSLRDDASAAVYALEQAVNCTHPDGPQSVAPLLVIRLMPAKSRYQRSPEHPANHRTMLDRPLVNHARRPLWLVQGEDRAGNDFVTGFAPAAPRWAGPLELGD